MEAALDSVGRLVVPKALRDALGLTTGTKVDISLYGSGLQVVPIGRTARLIPEMTGWSPTQPQASPTMTCLVCSS